MPSRVTDPAVSSFVHHEITAEEPVTVAENGPRVILVVPAARVVADLAGEAGEIKPLEPMALTEYE